MEGASRRVVSRSNPETSFCITSETPNKEFLSLAYKYAKGMTPRSCLSRLETPTAGKPRTSDPPRAGLPAGSGGWDEEIADGELRQTRGGGSSAELENGFQGRSGDLPRRLDPGSGKIYVERKRRRGNIPRFECSLHRRRYLMGVLLRGEREDGRSGA